MHVQDSAAALPRLGLAAAELEETDVAGGGDDRQEVARDVEAGGVALALFKVQSLLDRAGQVAALRS
eukprot:scaffold233776_cov38-Prasinocladus_malaysianus.AAC.1